MELFDDEIREARALIVSRGADPGKFGFTREDIAPDDEGNSMFTMRYEVTVRRDGVVKPGRYLGGIGLRWLDEFEADLRKGHYENG